jgi:hypothetical protein
MAFCPSQVLDALDDLRGGPDRGPLPALALIDGRGAPPVPVPVPVPVDEVAGAGRGVLVELVRDLRLLGADG